MQNVLNRIYQEFDLFSPKQQKIARVILESPKKVAQMNLEEFAEIVQVDEDNIIEFCEKLGFSNFIQLRERLGNHALKETKYSSKIWTALPTFEKENLLSLLTDASLIQVVGTNLDMQDKIVSLFNKNGIFTISASKQEISLAQTMHLDSKSVMVVLEPQEISLQLVKQVQIAKHQGVKIITLGKSLGKRVGMEADCFLKCEKEEVKVVLETIIEEVVDRNLKLQNFKMQYRNLLKSKLS